MSSPSVKAVAFFMDGTSNSKQQSADGLIHREDGATSVAVLSEWIPDWVPPGRADRYIRGVGAEPVTGPFWFIILAVNAVSQLTGHGLSERVREIYSRLCKDYRDGYAIYLFGFSRGATTARMVAGFVDEVGLLLESKLDLVEEAWSLYVRSGDLDASDLRAYLRRVIPNYTRPSRDNANQLPIDFLGVWDTVAMWCTIEGVLFDPVRRLARVPSNVSHARQAFAIHEVRRLFPELPWTAFHPDVPRPQSMKQVWFPGNHADVGGGYADGADTLTRHALAWMMNEARDQGLPVNVPASEMVVGKDEVLFVHDQSHRDVMMRVLAMLRQRTLAIRKGLANWQAFDEAIVDTLSLDEAYVRWLLDGRATTFEDGLPAETSMTMRSAEDAAVRMRLLQPYLREHVEPPTWVSDANADDVRGRATRFLEFLTSPPTPRAMDIAEIAKAITIQVLLQGVELWRESYRTIREAVAADLSGRDVPLETLDGWWRRLEQFKEAAALADADLPPSLNGKAIVDDLEKEVVRPVRDSVIEARFNGRVIAHPQFDS